MNKFWFAVTMSAALLVPGFAQTTPAPAKKESVIQQRKENQQKRIAQGVASGQLTPKETAKLENKEAKINQEIRTDRKANGGTLTQKEKAKVTHQQNQVSKQIYKEKHDAQTQK